MQIRAAPSSQRATAYLLKHAEAAAIKELFNLMDRDNNGSIDRLEWLAGYADYLQLLSGDGAAEPADVPRAGNWKARVSSC